MYRDIALDHLICGRIRPSACPLFTFQTVASIVALVMRMSSPFSHRLFVALVISNGKITDELTAAARRTPARL
jgi:hypothetical protein